MMVGGRELALRERALAEATTVRATQLAAYFGTASRAYRIVASWEALMSEAGGRAALIVVASMAVTAAAILWTLLRASPNPLPSTSAAVVVVAQTGADGNAAAGD